MSGVFGVFHYSVKDVQEVATLTKVLSASSVYSKYLGRTKLIKIMKQAIYIPDIF